jgi:hypothetical protein
MSAPPKLAGSNGWRTARPRRMENNKSVTSAPSPGSIARAAEVAAGKHHVILSTSYADLVTRCAACPIVVRGDDPESLAQNWGKHVEAMRREARRRRLHPASATLSPAGAITGAGTPDAVIQGDTGREA